MGSKSTQKSMWLISPFYLLRTVIPFAKKYSMNPDVTAFIPYDGQGLTTEVLSIIKKVVSLTLENKYKAENVNLLLF